MLTHSKLPKELFLRNTFIVTFSDLLKFYGEGLHDIMKYN